MKQLTLKLALPLTIITFFGCSRWICAEVVDAPNSSLQGFPLPYTCNGWATSLSLQFFVTEFIADLAVYFLTIFIALYLINRFVVNVRLHKSVSITLYVIAGLILGFQILILSLDTTFYLHRNFSIKEIKSEYSFFWQYHSGCY
jgi:hypothetical protein